MNVFFVDPDPVLAASMLCLQHRAKMLTESVQILCTAAHVIDAQGAADLQLWMPTHAKHPCVLWLRDYGIARRWLVLHAYKLAALHDNKRPESAINMLDRANEFFGKFLRLDGIYLPEPPQCMPPEFQRTGDPVKAYQLYYADKARLWATHGKPHLKMRYRDATCVPLWLESELGANWDRIIHFTNDFNRKG
jgi:hypothetical protein